MFYHSAWISGKTGGILRVMEKLKLPKDGFEMVIKHPKDVYENDSVWLIVHPDVGVRLHAHSHKREGVTLDEHELQALKQAIDYLTSGVELNLSGAATAMEPKD